MGTLPLDISIWDGNFNDLGSCNAPESVRVTPAHLLVGTATITLSLYDPKVALLGGKGNRVLIKYPGGIMSGPVRATAGQSQSQDTNGSITYTVEDDVRLFWRLLGYPVPGATLTAQGTGTDDSSGPAETVVKHYVSANVSRLGIPVTVAPDQGRGSNISASIRMQLLSDALLPSLATSGIGIMCYQEDDHLLFDVYETTTYPQTLTEKSGIVQAWSSSSQGPSVTRTVTGGAAVGTSQQYVLVTDTAAESDWHDIIESYTDDSSETDPAQLPAAGQATLDGGPATAGLSVTLSDTKNFKYGQSVKVGDTVTIEVGPGITVTDVLTQATVNLDRSTGFTITPIVGDLSSDTTKTLIKQMVSLARTVRKFLAK